MIYTDYAIKTSEYVQELAEVVRAAMREGWQPLGGPFLLGEPLRPHTVTFCQPMVKLAPDPAMAEIARMMDENHKLELEIAGMPS